MTLQNQPELPEAASKNRKAYSYADLPSSLMRVMFLFEKYDLTLKRAHNESCVHRYGNCIHYVYRKSSVHLSILLDHRENNPAELRVSLMLPPSHQGEIQKGEVRVSCCPNSSSWETLVLFFGDNERTEYLRRIAKEACLVEASPDGWKGCLSRQLSEQQAFAAITYFIEVFKSSSREASS